MADYLYVVCVCGGRKLFRPYRTDWRVAVYTTEEQAIEHVKRVTELAKERAEKYREERLKRPNEYIAYRDIPNPLDVEQNIGWEEPSYTVERIPYVRHVDEYLELAESEKKVIAVFN